MAGAMISNTVITDNKIIGYKTPLQGIFMSDGIAKNISIEDNVLLTQGAHYITLTGVIGKNSKINNNKFLKFDKTPTPVIRLDPLRIGGNMLGEGIVYVTGFSDTGINYDTVANSNNKLYFMPETEKANVAKGIINVDKSTSVEDVLFEDERQSIPDKYAALSVGLSSFKYADFKSAWFNATIANFSANDPKGLEGLTKWLTADVRKNNPNVVLAIDILKNQDVQGKPISMLQSTLLRVWILKRIALRHGTINTPSLSDMTSWIGIFEKYLLNDLYY